MDSGPVTVTTIQFVLGVYGGYFGGGVGLMMLAAWSLVANADIKALNPLRMMMVTAANTVAVLCFVGLGVVSWPQAIALGLGAIVGAHVGRRLPAAVVRTVTIALAVTITISFFYRAFFRA